MIALREIINASDVSSFELQHSGIVTSLLVFLTHESVKSKPSDTEYAPSFSMTTRRHSKQLEEEGEKEETEEDDILPNVEDILDDTDEAKEVLQIDRDDRLRLFLNIFADLPVRIYTKFMM